MMTPVTVIRVLAAYARKLELSTLQYGKRTEHIWLESNHARFVNSAWMKNEIERLY